MMEYQKDELWKKLDDFTFDQSSNVSLSFQSRLARENGWDDETSDEAIQEYKKFLFLAARSGHPITPSDEVDQVWHLHLQYSQNYWTELCQNTLGFEFHHGPTKGGRSEGRKFDDWYAKTKTSYETVFGEKPPEKYWPIAKKRFGLAPYFKRVNTKTHFVIEKKDPLTWLAGIFLVMFVVGLAMMAFG